MIWPFEVGFSLRALSTVLFQGSIEGHSFINSENHFDISGLGNQSADMHTCTYAHNNHHNFIPDKQQSWTGPGRKKCSMLILQWYIYNMTDLCQ